MSGCCVPGCGNRDKTRMPFHSLPRNEKLRKVWLEKIRNPALFDKPETTLNHRQVCSVHFEDKQYRTPNRQKLNRGVYPVLFLPVIQEVDIREFVKGFVPSLFNNGTTDNNNKESFKPVESNENDLQTKSNKIVEEFEVTQNSTDFKEEEEEVVLTTSNKQPDTDSDPLKKRLLQNPHCTGQCKDHELLMKRERNWNLVINENCALQKRVNILEIQNRILDRRLKNMKVLLKHYKNKHAR